MAAAGHVDGVEATYFVTTALKHGLYLVVDIALRVGNDVGRMKIQERWIDKEAGFACA